MANDNIPVRAGGPALGNVPTPDAYLRIKQNLEQLQTKFNELAGNVGPRALTAGQLSQIQKALQATGPNPLDLMALPGILLMPQPADIPAVKSLSTVGIDGQVVLYRHVIWRYSTASPRGWSVVSTIIIVDYEYNLPNYPPSQYAPGVLFLGINTGVTFVQEDTITNGVTTSDWVPLYSEQLVLLHADRFSIGVLNTGVSGNNFSATWVSGTLFRSSMVGQQIWIAGNLYPVSGYNNTTLIFLGANAGNANNANYAFEYPSVNYPYGAPLFEVDRTVMYYCGQAGGQVIVAGNNVSYNSGLPFDLYWRTINLGGNNYNIASVLSQSSLVLAGNGPANGSYAYVVARGAWYYQMGIFSNNAAPTDLNVITDQGFYLWNQNMTVMQRLNQANNFVYQWGRYTAALAAIPGNLLSADAGFVFAASDYGHEYQWGGNNWNFAPGDPGSQYIVQVPANTTPLGGLWGLCDGSAYTVATPGGNTTPVTTPNLTAGNLQSYMRR